MSPTPVRNRAPLPSQRSRRNMRLHRRYPIELDVEFMVMKGNHIEHSGCGRTVNMSSGGVLFETADFPETKDYPDDRRSIVLKMNRPLLLDDFALSLVMTGRIVRKDAGRIAVKADHYEFQTVGKVRR